MVAKKNIFYMGAYGFPFGYAQIQRQKLIAKGLHAQGAEVTVISRYGVHENGVDRAELEKGIHEGILFQYASGTPFRPESALKRNWLKLKGCLNEFRLIRQKKKTEGLDYILLSSNNFYNVFIYRLFSFFTGVPTVLDIVEHYSSFSNHKQQKWTTKLDNWLYDNKAFKYVDKVFCISDFLISNTKDRAPRTEILKVPAIVDFSKFEAKPAAAENYLLYCGDASYHDVLFFIIEAFEAIDNKDYKLYLVSFGHPDAREKVIKRVEASVKKDQIVVYDKMPYPQLVGLYLSSKALLIPLRNSLQDIARFPHKTGEYAASSKAIVSTEIGELKNYFIDKENALLAPSYDVKEYAAALNFVVSEPEKTFEIGHKGYLVGKEQFDHISLGKKIVQFLYP